MKRRIKAMVTVLILLLVLSVGLNIVLAGNQGAEPGSDQDPIVSKSYVDAAISQLASKIQLLLEQNDALKSQNEQMATRLTSQEQSIKALQEELKLTSAAPSTPAAGTGGSAGTAANPPASIGKGVVNTAVLNLRSQPNTTSSIIGKLLKNETVTLISKSGDWYKITTAKGTTGYVMGKFVTVKK